MTKPFGFEGAKRKLVAERAADALRQKVDTLIVIPNDRLKDVVTKNTSIIDAFKVVDDILRQGVQGISDIITMPGLINLDFADVRTIMKDAGTALMGIGRASGENRAVEAARQAISSPLLEVSITGAQGILFNVSGSANLGLFEVTEAAEEIRSAADPEANIIFGTSFDERLGDEVAITVIATGFDQVRRQTRPATAPAGAAAADQAAAGRPDGARALLPRRAGAPADDRRGRGGRRQPRRPPRPPRPRPRSSRPSAARRGRRSGGRTTRTTSRSRRSCAGRADPGRAGRGPAPPRRDRR